MWKRFTEGTRHAMVRAQQAASDRSENIVKPEHLLIGLLSENSTVAYRLRQEAGITVADLLGHLEEILTPGPGRDGSRLRLDPVAKRAIDLAWGEAQRQRCLFIGTEHLLLGILAADSGATGITFRHFALDLEKGRYLLDTVETFYPAPSALPDTGPGLAVASVQARLNSQDARHRRRELLPGLFIGVLLAIMVMALRGCG